VGRGVQGKTSKKIPNVKFAEVKGGEIRRKSGHSTKEGGIVTGEKNHLGTHKRFLPLDVGLQKDPFYDNANQSRY